MTGRQRLAVAGAALALIIGGSGVALAADGDLRATCTSNPKVTGQTVVAFDVHCSVPRPTTTVTRTVTVTQPPVTVTQTVTAAPSATTEPEPTTTTPPTTTNTTATPTPTTTTAPPPTSGDKPGPGNTGVPSGTVLTPYTGPKTITVDGTVIDSKDVTGALNIKARNVVIRNSKIHDDMSAVAGINVTDGSVTITDSEIYNFQVGIVYTNFTAERINMHDITFDGLKMSSNSALRNSWIHSPKPQADAHWDGVQVQNGVVNTVIEGNNIDPSGADTNSALFLCPDLGPTTDGPLIVRNNWLNGGNYTVFILDGNNGRYFIRDIQFAGNRFGRDHSFGPTYVNVPVTWVGNVWDDNGAPLEP